MSASLHPESVTSWTRRSGSNRGQRRVWLEGRRLLDAGWTRGTLLSKNVDADRILLTPVSAEEFAQLGGRARCRVAGTVERPIIDLSGAWVTKFMGDAEEVRVQIGRVLGNPVMIITRVSS